MNKKQNIQDDKLKDLFAFSKIKAGENLKYRIMQQIETENSLISCRKKEWKINVQIKTILTVMGVMYGIIALSALTIYLFNGKNELLSTGFFLAMIFITVVSVTFGLIIVFDNKLRAKMKGKDADRVL